jgi:hypothetical protein
MPFRLKRQMQLTSGVYNNVYIHSLGAMLRCMLTTWS